MHLPGRPALIASMALFLMAAAPAAHSEPRRYVIDPNHLTLAFLVDHIGFARVLGQFRQASGSFVFDEESRELSQVHIVVQTESVFSNQEQRDRHLRSVDFLNCREFPQMVYKAPASRLDPQGKAEVKGELTLLGVTRPLTLEVTWNKSAPSPMGGGAGEGGEKPYTLGASVRGSFKRSDFGMTYGVANGWVGDEVELIVELEAQRR